MPLLVGQAVDHRQWYPGIVQSLLDLVIAQYVRSVCHEQRAFVKSDATRIGQSFDNCALLRHRTTAHCQRIDIAGHAANEERAVGAHRHVPCLGHVRRQHGDPISGWRFEASNLNAFIFVPPVLDGAAPGNRNCHCRYYEGGSNVSGNDAVSRDRFHEVS